MLIGWEEIYFKKQRFIVFILTQVRLNGESDEFACHLVSVVEVMILFF